MTDRDLVDRIKAAIERGTARVESGSMAAADGGYRVITEVSLVVDPCEVELIELLKQAGGGK